MSVLFLSTLLVFGCGTKVSYEDDTGGSSADGDGGAAVDADLDGFDTNSDCDDDNPAVNPAAAEICDDIDNDCDGATDEGLKFTYYVDSDGDGFGDPLAVVESCDFTDGLSENPDDCDDAAAHVNPDADELCNGIDDDCDTVVDEDDAVDATAWYQDLDGDEYGDDDIHTVACAAPDLHVAAGGDCDDADADRYPGAPEYCNDIDDDCDEVVDEDDAVDAPTWYRDVDGDDFGIDGTTVVQCELPDGYAPVSGDCDDGDVDVNPDAEEICDGLDNDCNAATTEDLMVTFEGADGTLADVSSYFAEGTYASPEGWSLGGDGTFYFCQGTYYVFIGIEADVNLIGVHGSSETVLSAGDLVSVIDIEDDGVDTLISGFTLRDGEGDGLVFGNRSNPLAGGGIYCAANANVELDDVVITEATAGIGGAIYSEGCDFDIMSSELTDNTADYGGAIGSFDGAFTLSDTIVYENSATYSGGAFYFDGSADTTTTLTLGYSVVQENEATYGGGFMGYDGVASNCVGDEDATVGYFDNVATYGGAAFLYASTFRSTGCDWGSGSSDNTPEDIYVDPYAGRYDYGADEDFYCTSLNCD